MENVLLVNSFSLDGNDFLTQFSAFIVAAVFAALLALLNVLIIYGVIYEWKGKQRHHACSKATVQLVRSRIIIPIFGGLVFFCWIFSMVFVVGSLMTADTCYGGPDDRVASLLLEFGDFWDSFIIRAAVFYILGCPVGQNMEPDELIEKANNIKASIMDAVTMASATTSEGADLIFEETCGISPLIVSSSAVAASIWLCNFGKALTSIQIYFSCENWRPLYTEVFYNALCYQGNDAFFFITFSLFGIVILSMLMLSMRAAFIKTPENKSCPMQEAHESDSSSPINLQASMQSERGEGNDGTENLVGYCANNHGISQNETVENRQ
jgi:hypothetical protein